MAELSHLDAGRRDARTLILVGGIGTTSRVWSDQVTALSGRFRVVAPDLRGHGRSAVPPTPYTVPELGGDVLELMDRLGIEEAAYCGLSLGGMVGVWLASEVPSRVSRLALSCTAVRVEPQLWRDRIRQVRSAGLGSLVDGTMQRWFTEEFREVRPEVVASAAEQLLATSVEGYVGCCQAVAGLDIEDRLTLIAAPTLFIGAELDRTMPAAEAERMAAAVRSSGTPARTATVGHAAHLANVEQPERFTSLLAAHLDA